MPRVCAVPFDTGWADCCCAPIWSIFAKIERTIPLCLAYLRVVDYSWAISGAVFDADFLMGCAVLLAIIITGYRQLYKAIDQFWIGDASGFPEFGIHADAREARHGVDFVEIELAC